MLSSSNISFRLCRVDISPASPSVVAYLLRSTFSKPRPIHGEKSDRVVPEKCKASSFPPVPRVDAVDKHVVYDGLR